MTSATERDGRELLALWARFLDGVQTADPERIAACVTADVTMFVPFRGARDSVQGREAVVALFARLFELTQSTLGPATNAGITIERFECRPLAAEVYLAESMLRFGADIGRRSVIFGREAGEWRILHLHGSNVPAPPPGRLPAALG